MDFGHRTRVLHLIESDGLYGAESVVLTLAREGKSDERFAPIIGCIVSQRGEKNCLYDRAQGLGLDAVKLEVRSRHAVLDVLRVVRSLRNLHVGLIHAHGYKSTIVGYVAHLANRCPIIATCHNWSEDSQCKWTYRALTKLEIRMYRWFRRVVAVSNPIADALLAHGVRSDQVEVIPNGIHTTDYTGRKSERVDELRERFKPRADSLVLVNVGRLVEQKAQADVIDAAALLRTDYAALQVIIVGEGHLRSGLEEKVLTLSLQDSVHLVGFRENVVDYLAIADAFVLPSIDEGMPIALLEALAAGVPVICTAVGAIPQLVEHEVTGLVIPIGSPEAIRSAVARLIQDPKLGRRLAQAGKESLRLANTADAMYGRYRRLYEELAGSFK